MHKISKTNKKFDMKLSNLYTNSLFLTPTTKKQIESIIKSLKLNKAIGPNTIRRKFLNK